MAQASSHAVAAQRSKEIESRCGAGPIWDATSGIGADSLAVALNGRRVWSSDRDPRTLAFARANLEHGGLAAKCFVADATTHPLKELPAGVLVDPDRRPGGRRSLDPRRWSPTLEQSLRLADRVGAACLKLPPAFEANQLGDERAATTELTWLSWRGELAAVDAWCGSWAGQQSSPGREALAIDRNGTVARFAGQPEAVEPLAATEARAISWLANPDPALVRAGLLGTLAKREDMAPIAPSIGFLGGEQPARSGLLRCWRVLEAVSLDRKHIRRALGEHGIGPIQVLKRGHPDSAEVLARRFRGPGNKPGWLAVARLERGHLGFVLEAPVAEPASGLESS